MLYVYLANLPRIPLSFSLLLILLGLCEPCYFLLTLNDVSSVMCNVLSSLCNLKSRWFYSHKVEFSNNLYSRECPHLIEKLDYNFYARNLHSVSITCLATLRGQPSYFTFGFCFNYFNLVLLHYRLKVCFLFSSLKQKCYHETNDYVHHPDSVTNLLS